MKKTLLPQHIHFIEIDKTQTLFFHSETLQIYPLHNENEILSFLHLIKENGLKDAQVKYGKNFNNIYKYVTDTLFSTPTHVISSNPNEKHICYETVIVPISSHCNLACPYCFAQTDRGFHFGEYTKEHIVQLLSFIMSQKKDYESPTTLVFFGGEPLLKYDLILFTIHYIQQKKWENYFRYSITTNGTIISKEIIHTINKYHISVLLSVDGPDNEFNLRKYKNGEKSINDVLKNIQTLKESNVAFELRATIVSTNPYICETFEFFEDLGIPFYIVFAYSSENKTHHYAEYQVPTLDNIRTQFDNLETYYKDKLLRKETIYNRQLNEQVNTIRFRIKRDIACSAGLNFFTITANGDIFSCAHFFNNDKYRVGNINEPTFFQASLQKFSPSPIKSINGCQKCWVKNLCLGGCMSQKVLSNLQSNEPYSYGECTLRKIEWNFYIKFYYYATQYMPEIFAMKTNNSHENLC